jgi:hypothetical protein
VNDCSLSGDGGVVEVFVDVNRRTCLHFHLFVTHQSFSELEHPRVIHEFLSRRSLERVDGETFFEEADAASLSCPGSGNGGCWVATPIWNMMALSTRQNNDYEFGE